MNPKFYLIILVLISRSLLVHGTHNKGGDITYRYVSGFTYEIKITTYTKVSGTSINADRPVLDSVFLGDGTSSPFNRMFHVDILSQDLRINTYIQLHTYPGEGIYTIYLLDPNRNADIANMQQSVNQPFSVQSDIAVFDPQIHCINNSSV